MHFHYVGEKVQFLFLANLLALALSLGEQNKSL
jgi:hypothetical protein